MPSSGGAENFWVFGAEPSSGGNVEADAIGVRPYPGPPDSIRGVRLSSVIRRARRSELIAVNRGHPSSRLDVDAAAHRAHDRRVSTPRSEAESVLGAELRGEVVEKRRRDLQDVAAALAHQVVVGTMGKVEHGATGSQLDPLRRCRARAADRGSGTRCSRRTRDRRRGRRRRCPPPSCGARDPDECVDDHAARPGHPPAAVTQSLDDLVGPRRWPPRR